VHGSTMISFCVAWQLMGCCSIMVSIGFNAAVRSVVIIATIFFLLLLIQS